jgi:hypothetical protein
MNDICRAKMLCFLLFAEFFDVFVMALVFSGCHGWAEPIFLKFFFHFFFVLVFHRVDCCVGWDKALL